MHRRELRAWAQGFLVFLLANNSGHKPVPVLRCLLRRKTVLKSATGATLLFSTMIGAGVLNTHLALPVGKASDHDDGERQKALNHAIPTLTDPPRASPRRADGGGRGRSQPDFRG